MNKSGKGHIILSESLKSYFFKQLKEINQKSLCPVPEETIYYSSEVLENCAFSSSLFNFEDGRVKHKILGKKLLEASACSSETKKRTYKEVGDTALIMSGYFSRSINDKILGHDYYYRLGQMAYEKLNASQPACFDIPSFYKIMSTCFENLASMMAIVMDLNASNQDTLYLLKEGVPKFNAILGISPNHSKKVS